MSGPSTYTETKLYVSLSGNASYATAPDEAYKFEAESLRKVGSTIYPPGTAGTRSEIAELVRAGLVTVTGSIAIYPTPTWLRNWLPRIFGAAESGAGTGASPFAYALAETLPSFVVSKDLGTSVHHYLGCKVARATLTFRPGMPLRLDMDIEGLSEVLAAAGSISSPVAISLATKPFVMSDVVLTAASHARVVDEISVTIDNQLKTDRFNNSITRTDLPELGRIVTWSIRTPYEAGTGANGHADLYDMLYSGVGLSVVATQAQDATKKLTLASASVQIPAETPVASTRDENMLTLTGIARSLGGANLEISANLQTAT